MATKKTGATSSTSKQKKASGSSVKNPASRKKPVATRKPIGKTNKSKVKKPSFEEISSKAYEIYLERTARGETGYPETDWHIAERILKV
jgi:hypothetical protein